MRKKLLSVLLALTMVLSLAPTAAFAADEGTPAQPAELESYRIVEAGVVKGANLPGNIPSIEGTLADKDYCYVKLNKAAPAGYKILLAVFPGSTATGQYIVAYSENEAVDTIYFPVSQMVKWYYGSNDTRDTLEAFGSPEKLWFQVNLVTTETAATNNPLPHNSITKTGGSTNLELVEIDVATPFKIEPAFAAATLAEITDLDDGKPATAFQEWTLGEPDADPLDGYDVVYHPEGTLSVVNNWTAYWPDNTAEQSGYFAAIKVSGLPAGTEVTHGSENKTDVADDDGNLVIVTRLGDESIVGNDGKFPSVAGQRKAMVMTIDGKKYLFVFDKVTDPSKVEPAAPTIDVTAATQADTDTENPATPPLSTEYDVAVDGTTVTVTAKNIKSHKNGQGNPGYWIGATFTPVAADGDDTDYVILYKSNDTWGIDTDSCNDGSIVSLYIDAFKDGELNTTGGNITVGVFEKKADGETYADADALTQATYNVKAADDCSKYVAPVVNFTVTFKDGDTTLSTQTVAEGGKAAKPANPSKEGFVFAGWFVGDDAFDFENTAITADITITAKWTEVTNTNVDKPSTVDGTNASTTVDNVGTITEDPENPVEVTINTKAEDETEGAAVTKSEVTLPATATSELAKAEQTTVQTDVADVVLPKDFMEAVKDSDLKLTVEKANDGSYSVKVESTDGNGDSVNLAGKTITMKFQKPSATMKKPVAYIVDNDGNKVEVPTTVDADGKVSADLPADYTGTVTIEEAGEPVVPDDKEVTLTKSGNEYSADLSGVTLTGATWMFVQYKTESGYVTTLQNVTEDIDEVSFGDISAESVSEGYFAILNCATKPTFTAGTGYTGFSSETDVLAFGAAQ